jgi:hypothetical protein
VERVILQSILALLALAGCSRETATANPPEPSATGSIVSPTNAPSTPIASAVSSRRTASAGDAASVTASARREFRVTAKGFPFALRVEGDVVSFCDERGARRIDLETGQDTAADSPCPKDGESNMGCGEVAGVDDVRTPNLGPIDIVDLSSGMSAPLEGRVHDCASDGKTIIVGTGVDVVLIDPWTGHTTTVAHDGSDRVAIGPHWVAWIEGKNVRAKRR